MTSVAPPSTQRRVRFAEQHVCVEFERHEKHEDLWFSKEACNRNKDLCVKVARYWARKGYDVLLNDTYQKPCSGAQNKLNTLAQLEPEKGGCIPRGIERFVCAKHADERRLTKTHCIESVVDFCTYMKRQNKSLSEMEEDLRELSEEHSAVSRHFAKRIAHADARAVREQEGYDDDIKSTCSSMTAASTISTSTTKSFRGKLSSKAILGTKKLTRMITGHRHHANNNSNHSVVCSW